jgi:hypothetical protein
VSVVSTTDLKERKIASDRDRQYRGYIVASASLELCRRQAFRNIALWYFRLGRIFPVYRTGTVFHPGRVTRLVASLNLPLVFGRPVIVTDRYIHIFVPRRNQRLTLHWSGDRVRHSPRVRRITIDTDRVRRVVGDGIFAPRGRVVYTAGPSINYTEIVRLHLTGIIRGKRNHYGDPVIAESVDSQTPETTVV